MLPLVDETDAVVEFRLARGEFQRFLCLDECIGQSAARRQAAGAAVMRARFPDVLSERGIVGVLGFIEQPEGPERVAIERLPARVGWLVGCQAVGFRVGVGEVARPQERQDETRLRPSPDCPVLGRRGDGATIGFLRVPEARLVHEQIAELQLDVGRRRLRRLRQEQQRQGHSRGTRDGESRKKAHVTLTRRADRSTAVGQSADQRTIA